MCELVAQHLIPESVVDITAQELQNVNAVNQQYSQQSLTLCLQENGVKSECISSVKNVLHNSDLIKCCLDEGGVLHMAHKRSSYLKQHFLYVSPESIYMSVNSRNKTCYCYYVPVKKSLEALLSDDTVLQQCFGSHFSNHNVLSDFTDDSVYKKCKESGDQVKKRLSFCTRMHLK